MEVGSDRAEVDVDLPDLGLPRSRELLVDRRFESVTGADISEHRRDQHGDRTQQKQGREELGRQPPAYRPSWDSGIGRGHGSTLDESARACAARYILTEIDRYSGLSRN